MTGQPTGHLTAGGAPSRPGTVREGGGSPGDAEERPLSMAEQIRRSALKVRSARPAPLKLVTLKVPPELDDEVEIHCQMTGRKKQEVIRDALRLYLEVVEQAQREGG